MAVIDVCCEHTGEITRFRKPKKLKINDRFFSSDSAQKSHLDLERLRGVRLVHIDCLHAPELPTRRDADRKSYRFLVEAVRDQGVVVPLIVQRTLDHAPCSYTVLSGVKRYHAARAVGEHIIPVKAVLGVPSKVSLQLLDAIVGDDLDVFEAAKKMRRLQIRGKTVDGVHKEYSQRELSRLTGIELPRVNSLLILAKGVTRGVREAFTSGDISRDALFMLSRLPKDIQREELAAAKKLSDKDLKARVRQLRGSFVIAPELTKKHGLRRYTIRHIDTLVSLLSELELSYFTKRPHRRKEYQFLRGQVAMLQYVLSVVDSPNNEPLEPITSRKRARRKHLMRKSARIFPEKIEEFEDDGISL